MRLWVTDNIDGSRIELEQRGKGFQWFLSFYIVFNVESEEGHKAAILLLDDPGLYLHASAQANLVRVLRRLSEKNQLIYTTHSPFMIDMEALDTIRTVTESRETGTRISDRMWATDKEALFPLQTALGYSISQSLFVGQNNLVVEGITDYWILSTLSTMFREAGLKGIDESLVISPAGGAHKAGLLAAMYAGQKLKTIVLLDADKEGKLARDELVKSKAVKDTNVIFVSEAVPHPKDEIELEDLFPEDFYLKYVNKAYYKELNGKELVAPLSDTSPLIRRRLEEECEKFNIRFHKSRPARLMLEEFPKMKPNDLPKELVERMERLFELINARKAT